MNKVTIEYIAPSEDLAYEFIQKVYDYVDTIHSLNVGCITTYGGDEAKVSIY